jgi:hypothetical protein
MSRVITGISVVAAVVGAAAAIIVVPEVRCALKLELPDGVQCVGRHDSSPSDGASVEQQILLVRSLYQRMEDDQRAGRMDVARKAVTGIGGDSAVAIIFRRGGEVAKVQAWVYAGARRTSMEVFYEGSQPRFVYRTVIQGAREVEQQRYYFTGGRMIRWLDADHDPVSPGSKSFRSRGSEVAQFAATLLAGSTAPDDVIRF